MTDFGSPSMRWMLVVMALALVIAACSGDGGDDEAGTVLGRVLIDEAPRGYALVEGPATGPMDLDEAATSTEASQSALRRQLGTTGFQVGYAKVWKNGEAFIAALVYEFLTNRRATELVTFMAEQLAGKRSAQAFAVPEIPGGTGSILNARNDKGISLFCQLVWFSVEERAFGVRVCDTSPNNTGLVTALAERQYDEARRGEMIAPPTTSPS